ncbi:hypothetical protein [Micromonospora profundi]|uniref:hypothetical protein n=1 Tax=Micromonospora profundi TaxID=1420889 RepID=UPI003665F9FF
MDSVDGVRAGCGLLKAFRTPPPYFLPGLPLGVVRLLGDVLARSTICLKGMFGTLPFLSTMGISVR